MKTRPKSNAGRKPIENPFHKLETRYFSMSVGDWNQLDAIALKNNCNTKDIIRGLITMLLNDAENIAIKYEDENPNDQA